MTSIIYNAVCMIMNKTSGVRIEKLIDCSVIFLCMVNCFVLRVKKMGQVEIVLIREGLRIVSCSIVQ